MTKQVQFKYFRSIEVSIKLRKGIGKLEGTFVERDILKEQVQRYIGSRMGWGGGCLLGPGGAE